jgi:parallel beta-helix repeat protein
VNVTYRILIMFAPLCFCFVMPQSASPAATYYVDTDHSAARDNNPGTEAQPFKTIEKAVSSLQPGDTVYIKAGTYREGVILRRSGTPARPIKIMAYPGDEGKVIINAAERITRWRKCTSPEDCAGNPNWNHIYHSDVSALVEAHTDTDFAIRQVFQQGQLLNRSRYPNRGWSYPSRVVDPQTIFSDRTLSKPHGYFTGSTCHIKTAVWQLDQIDIADHTAATITLSKSPRYNISTELGYYITNIVGEINEEGEWAYDPFLNKLYVWPKAGVEHNIEVTYRNYCIQTYGGVSSNEIRGLTLRNAYVYGLWLYGANGVTVEDNTIEHSFEYGIHLQGTGEPCENNHILNNTIRHSCRRGINVHNSSNYNTIEGNYVYASGAEFFGDDLMNGRGMGIFVGGPYTRVVNNRIDRTGYTSLYLYGDTLSREVSYNYITNTGLSVSDGGGIYTGGYSDVPEQDYIHHNILEDMIGCRSMEKSHDNGRLPTIATHSGATPGIYVDEEGNNRIIEHNTVINSHMAGIFFHWAPSNVVRHNTLYGNREYQILLSGKYETRKILENDELSNNILFATDAEQKTLAIAINYNDVHFGQSDDNYLYNPFESRHVYVSRYAGGSWIQEDLTLAEWRSRSGYDRHSKEFSGLEQLNGITIDRQKESCILYNPSMEIVSVDLGSEKYCDVDGNKIYGSVILQPFESVVLISANYFQIFNSSQ